MGIDLSPVDVVGCNLWRTCDRKQWPTRGDWPMMCGARTQSHLGPKWLEVLRMRARRRLALVLFLLAGQALVPACAAHAQSNATSVSDPKGDVVTITVNIDAPGLTDKEAKQWKNDAETVWNTGFEKWPAQCFKLHLVVNIRPQPAMTAEEIAKARPRRDHHLIYRGSFAKPFGSDVSGAKSFKEDTTYPLENATWGAWGYDVDALQNQGAGAYAHEVGHLMGLGDDYIDHPATSQHPRSTPPKPGRKDTLMADGGPVDKQLVDRLTNQLRRAGKLPSCGLKFGAVRFDMRPDGNVYHDISGRVCGDPFGRPWDVSWTVTNWSVPSNTGTEVVYVSIPGAGVEAAGRGPAFGISDGASHLHLTFLEGTPPQIKVTLAGQTHHVATVPLEEDKTCSERKGVS